MSDLISRREAIDALDEEPEVWMGDDYALGQRNQWQYDVTALKAVPSAQPEIIRCENCKHCEMTDNYNYCKVWRRETSIDGYCYKGDAND